MEEDKEEAGLLVEVDAVKQLRSNFSSCRRRYFHFCFNLLSYYITVIVKVLFQDLQMMELEDEAEAGELVVAEEKDAELDETDPNRIKSFPNRMQ